MAEQGRDFYKDKASKLYGIPYEEVTKEQRAEAKKLLPIYGGKVEYPKLFIDGKEYPFPISIQKCGVVDFENGTVTYYERKK